MVAMGRKGGERDTRPVDPMTGRFVDAEKKTPVIIDNQPKEEDNAQDKSPWFISLKEEDESPWTIGVSLCLCSFEVQFGTFV